MRILHLIPTLKHGGAERQARQLLFALNEKGIDVAVFSRVDAADTIELRSRGITVRPIHCKSNYHPQLLTGLATFVRDWKPHLIQTWMPMMDILGGFVALTVGIPFVISERSAGANYSERGKALARKFLGHGATAVVANSPAGMDYWKGHPRLHLIPNGLDLDAIRVATPGPRPLHRPLLVCLARLGPEKNLSRLIQSILIVRDRFPNVALKILGEGPERAPLEKMIVEYGLQANVELAGYRTDAWSWLKTADIAALVSHFEGSPNAALEAAATGCPMVLSDIPSHRWAFSSEQAIFVDKDRAEAIAAGILEGLTDLERVKGFSAAARSRVAKLSLASSADRYLELYHDAMKRP